MQCPAKASSTDSATASEPAIAPASPFQLPSTAMFDREVERLPIAPGPARHTRQQKRVSGCWGWIWKEPISGDETLITLHRLRLDAERSKPNLPGLRLARFNIE